VGFCEHGDKDCRSITSGSLWTKCVTISFSGKTLHPEFSQLGLERKRAEGRLKETCSQFLFRSLRKPPDSCAMSIRNRFGSNSVYANTVKHHVIKAYGGVEINLHSSLTPALDGGVQGVPGALSLEVKWPGRVADHSLPSSAEVNNACSYTSTPSIRLHGVVHS
jgi:hypothetical protein